MNHQFVFIVLNITSVCCLSCSEVRDFPDEKKLTINELKAISQQEIIKCHSHLGKGPLGQQEARYIWQAIVQHYDGVPNIPDNVLMMLRWVTAAVTPEDIANMTLSDIDVIQNFGLNYNLEEAQLIAIADRVREDFMGKEPEEFTYYDLTALRQILCAFNRSEIERIRPRVYKESALLIGNLKNCNPDVMIGFANLAIQPSAFGNPKNWSQRIIKILGAVADYLPKGVLINKAKNSQTNNM